MKYICTLIPVYLLLPVFLLSQPGSSCSSPYTLTLDGVERSYAASSNTGGPINCTIAGNSPITYFSFTSNAAGEMPLLHIIAPGGGNCEIAPYVGNCTNGNLLDPSLMCFWDGEGLWAPAHDYTVLPNTVYNLRIKTANSGNILISAQNYTPANNTCLGATPIGPTLTNDNNACHRPGTGITPGQLCATTLENTAFYTYTVENTGITSVSIENAICDNANGTAQVGFQVGFFQGSCSNLWWFQCYAGFGSNVQANTGILTAGTQIYVAIDGIGGSNCSYSIRALNAEVLSSRIKYFSAWKRPEGNNLKWISMQEVNNASYEIERSSDGAHFSTIGALAGRINSNAEKQYEFEDVDAPELCYYRLKSISTSGKFSYSEIIKVDRRDTSPFRITINNPVSNQLNMMVTTSVAKMADITVRNMNGQVLSKDKMSFIRGVSTYKKDLSFLKTGLYTVSITTDDWSGIKRFIKVE